MSPRPWFLLGAAHARKLLLGALLVGLVGAAIAIAAGPDIDGPLGRIGVMLVLAAMLVGFVITPLAFVLSIVSMRHRARHPGTAEEEPRVERPDVASRERNQH